MMRCVLPGLLLSFSVSSILGYVADLVSCWGGGCRITHAAPCADVVDADGRKSWRELGWRTLRVSEESPTEHEGGLGLQSRPRVWKRLRHGSSPWS